MVRKMFLLWGLASVVLATGDARAQDVVSDQFYGSGVHRYFSGDLHSAHSDFTAAIQAGTEDPRPYYFRALAYLRMGRPTQARTDLQKGADLEAADINDSYQVSKSLERVQGSLRLQLERHRRQARAIAQQRQDQQRRERYAAARRSEADRVQRASAIEDQPAGRAVAPLAADAPFRDDAEPAPFSAAPGEALSGRPRPDPRADATTEAFAPPPAAAADASPFGGPPAAASPAADDVAPFGGPPAAAEAPADAVFTPFGGPPAAEAEAPAATADPSADSTNTINPLGTPAASPDASVDAPPATFAPATTPPPAAADGPANPFGEPIAPAPGTSDAAPDATTANPFNSEPAPAARTPADSTFSATADMPLGAPAAGNTTAAPAQNGASQPSAGGGIFRALRRASGFDAAVDTVGSAAKALPIGGARGTTERQKAVPPAQFRGQPVDDSSVLMIGPRGGGPPPAASAPAGAALDQAMPATGAGPANPPPADGDNPFGAPAAGANDGDNPFLPPPAGAQEPPTGANPFQDDPVQPAPPPANTPR